jgi:hypothetical protein
VIAEPLIIAAAVATGIVTAIVAYARRWSISDVLAASVLSLMSIIIWRGISNVLGLNADYMPGVSVGDTGCLFFGAIGPLIIAAFRRRRDLWWPVIAGGVTAFIVNVVIL